MPPTDTSRRSRPREMDSRRRRTLSLSTLKLKEPAPSSKPTSTDSRTKSPNREARRGRGTDARTLTSLVQRSKDYIKQSRSTTRRIDRDPPKIDNDQGYDVNIRAPRSRSLNRRQPDCGVNDRAPRSRSTNSRRPRQSNLGSNRRSSLPGRRNPSPTTTSYTRAESPSSRWRSSKSQQQQYNSSRNSHSRANSKEHFDDGSCHHEDFGVNDSRQISYDNSRSRANSKERYNKDFGNSDSKLTVKVAHNHEHIKNSSSFDETSHYSRPIFTETEKLLNNAPIADDRVVRSMVEDIAPDTDEHSIRLIVGTVLHQLHCNNAYSHQEERHGQHNLNSSIHSCPPPDREKKREEAVAKKDIRDNNVEDIISQISRVKERNIRSRSRGRSRSKSKDGRNNHVDNIISQISRAKEKNVQSRSRGRSRSKSKDGRDNNIDNIISQISRFKERNVRSGSRGRSRSKSKDGRDNNVDNIISQISRVKERNMRSRSRGRSRSKSKDGRLEKSSSSSTFTMTTKSSNSSGYASAITSESKTSWETCRPLPPPHPPISSNDEQFPCNSAVSRDLKLSLEYMCNKLAETEPASSIPEILPSNSQEGAHCPKRTAPFPIGKRNVPPPRHDLSVRDKRCAPSHLAKSKSQPPPPPPHRRNMNNRVAPTMTMSTPTASRSRARSRSRDSRQPKKDNNQERHNSGGQGGHNKIISPGSASMNASKMSCSAPPPPPRPPPHRSASMDAIVSAENNGDARSIPPPPVHTRQGRKSAPDISASGNSLLCHKASPPPPPPPARRICSQATLQDHGQSHSSLFNSSSTSLNNTSNAIPTSHSIVPMPDIPTTPAISNATNQPQLQTHRNRNNKNHPVSSMWYIDPYGDSGVYSGEVDDDSRPHGKGKMKYDNGVFYEGNWTHGSKDETQGGASGDQLTNVTRDRMLNGFTSWKGQRKKDSKGKDKGDSGGAAFVYGMEWVDLVGTPGKYTGQVNSDNEPEGKGVMKYDFGLVAEGKWIKGKLIDGAGGGMGSGIMAQSVAGGMSVAPRGMSLASSAASVVSGLGMMSICGGGGGGMMMGGYPNGMLNQYMNPNMPMAATYYNPAGAMMAGAPVAVNYQQQPGMPMSHPDTMSGGGNAQVPTNGIALGEKK